MLVLGVGGITIINNNYNYIKQVLCLCQIFYKVRCSLPQKKQQPYSGLLKAAEIASGAPSGSRTCQVSLPGLGYNWINGCALSAVQFKPAVNGRPIQRFKDRPSVSILT